MDAFSFSMWIYTSSWHWWLQHSGSDLFLQAIVLYQADVEGRGPALRPIQHQTDSLTRSCWQSQSFHSCVQGLLRHGPVGGPLTTSNTHAHTFDDRTQTLSNMLCCNEANQPAMVTNPLSLMLTTWFLQIDWVSLEFGSVTRGRIPLQAARTSPRRTADDTNHNRQAEALIFLSRN